MVLPFFIIRKSFKLKEKFVFRFVSFRFVSLKWKWKWHCELCVCVCFIELMFLLFLWHLVITEKPPIIIWTNRCSLNWWFRNNFVWPFSGWFHFRLLFCFCFGFDFFYFSFLMMKIQRFKIHHNNICYWTSCVHIQCSDPLLEDCFACVLTQRVWALFSLDLL